MMNKFVKNVTITKVFIMQTMILSVAVLSDIIMINQYLLAATISHNCLNLFKIAIFSTTIHQYYNAEIQLMKKTKLKVVLNNVKLVLIISTNKDVVKMRNFTINKVSLAIKLQQFTLICKIVNNSMIIINARNAKMITCIFLMEIVAF